jgi:hypothetical protein
MPYFEDGDGQVLSGFAMEPTDSIAEFLAERFLRRRHRRAYRHKYHGQNRARSALYGAVIGALTGAIIPSLSGMSLNKAGRINEILAEVAKAMSQSLGPQAEPGGVTVAEAKAMGWTCKNRVWTCPMCNEAHASEPLRTQPEPEPEPEASDNGIFSKDIFGSEGKCEADEA